MTLPVTIPNTFANATSSIPLSQLDANFSTLSNVINQINAGTQAVANLTSSNVTITGGTIANVTLDNVTVDVETLSNVTINGGNVTVTNMVATTANATTGNITTVNATTIDTTNIEVTNIKAKDGTAALSIADSTGVTTQSTPAVISVNSSSDALRITQTGAGNALLVEDSANPDATPFVVGAGGEVRVGLSTDIPVGATVGRSIQNFSGTGATGFAAGASFVRGTADTGGPVVALGKTRSTSSGSNTIVNSGDSLGAIRWAGDDGVNLQSYGAEISAWVDGTPGSSDMPGRLVFFTTADGASSPTERMRIDNAGRIGIGVTNQSGSGGALRIGQSLTGSVDAVGINQVGTAQSDVTNSVSGIRSAVSTAATSFTLTNLRNFIAQQGSIGAGSTVTNQVGFFASSNLTGATNNYGFYSDIASGTGRWNFYANGTAASYFGGDVQFKKAIIEEVYTITDGAAFEIDPSNGTMQLITLGASRTPKATNFAAGESITLMVNDGSAYTITWTDATWGGSGVVWLTNSGTAPTLATTGYTTIVLWKVGSQVYGARVGDNA